MAALPGGGAAGGPRISGRRSRRRKRVSWRGIGCRRGLRRRRRNGSLRHRGRRSRIDALDRDPQVLDVRIQQLEREVRLAARIGHQHVGALAQLHVEAVAGAAARSAPGGCCAPRRSRWCPSVTGDRDFDRIAAVAWRHRETRSSPLEAALPVGGDVPCARRAADCWRR